ncbi:alpha/beta fold hydrolase [Deinococcus apachensis]|uniref:alpha/beta fold hydrolase n=1 Tax=Deinococcus apachensis TaxID=309886 RepID=UPI000370CAEB|nr:alpha/beta fold hydrolase [Deinococcus apachensis]
MSRLQGRLSFSPRLRTVLALILVLLVGGAVGRLSTVLLRPPLVLGQDAAYPGAVATVRLEGEPHPFIDIRPRNGRAHTLLVLYPGGLVRPQAYEWLGRALAADGVQTVIPVFPLDLAVLGVNRAGELISRFGQGKRVVLAGHSLGGAMAASYAAKHPQDLSGLILMAAYPAQNVSLQNAPYPVLSLLAERDGVASAADVRGGLARLPPDTTLTVLPGAVHAFFGRYGPQRGDGQPTATREETERRIVTAVRAFLHALPERDAASRQPAHQGR